jgi:hypothetical protein
MPKEQVLGYKPAPRLEEVDDEHCERMQEREHCPRSCDSQAGWDFRKGQVKQRRVGSRSVSHSTISRL